MQPLENQLQKLLISVCQKNSYFVVRKLIIVKFMKKLLIIITVILLGQNNVRADEGIWLPMIA